MQQWYIYIVRCADNSLYCGITTDIQRRLAQHNGEISGGAKCTRARRPVFLEACVLCESRGSATKHEARIKKLPRDQKLSALLALTSL